MGKRGSENSQSTSEKSKLPRSKVIKKQPSDVKIPEPLKNNKSMSLQNFRMPKTSPQNEPNQAPFEENKSIAGHQLSVHDELRRRSNSVIGFPNMIKRMMDSKQKATTYAQKAFTALDTTMKGYLTKAEILEPIYYHGVETHCALQGLMRIVESKNDEYRFEFLEFERINSHFEIYKKVLSGELVIPDFHQFKKTFGSFYEIISQDQQRFGKGKVPNIFPSLTKANPEFFATSFCSLAGQFVQFGDYNQKFPMMYICKPVIYAFLLDMMGEELNDYLDVEPSGKPFNAPVFTSNKKPHNPLITSGAIMVCFLLLKRGKNINDILNFYQRATQQKEIPIDPDMFHEHKVRGYTTHAMASLMLANRAFCRNALENVTKDQVDAALDLYFQVCAIMTNVEALARFGAMLANDGVNPSTGQRVLAPQTIKVVVTVMSTCGMYDRAGRFLVDFGLPTKCGISGGLLSVVPGIGSVVSWSPKLDGQMNSVKGLALLEMLGKTYNNFNLFHKDQLKRDILARPYQTTITTVTEAILCAMMGDNDDLERLHIKGADLNKGDYDLRTPLHLAAANRQIETISFLVKNGVDVNRKDRWGVTPLDDALDQDVEYMLIKNGAVHGKRLEPYHNSSKVAVSYDQYRLFYAAQDNNLSLLKSLQIELDDLNVIDYDLRTPLGIAASEGNLDCVKYLLHHGADVTHKDARGNDALADAKREKRTEVIKYIQKFMKDEGLIRTNS